MLKTPGDCKIMAFVLLVFCGSQTRKLESFPAESRGQWWVVTPADCSWGKKEGHLHWNAGQTVPPGQEGASVQSRKKPTESSEHWRNGEFNCSHQCPSPWNTQTAESHWEIIVIVYSPIRSNLAFSLMTKVIFQKEHSMLLCFSEMLLFFKTEGWRCFLLYVNI